MNKTGLVDYLPEAHPGLIFIDGVPISVELLAYALRLVRAGNAFSIPLLPSDDCSDCDRTFDGDDN
jgi:hypothetical protein